jgi:hypothetical protein
MFRCTLCGRPLAPTTAWKGRGERYYCSEFCAESEEPQNASAIEGIAARLPNALRSGWSDRIVAGRAAPARGVSRAADPAPRKRA